MSPAVSRSSNPDMLPPLFPLPRSRLPFGALINIVVWLRHNRRPPDYTKNLFGDFGSRGVSADHAPAPWLVV